MRELSVEESKALQLELLEIIADTCRQEGLTYYIAFGTLLGAVRHKGYIPWDDDIDIWIPPADYKRLMDVLAKKEGYQVLDYQRDNFWLLYAKFGDARTVMADGDIQEDPHRRCVSVDIFPLIGMRAGWNRIFMCVSMLRKLMYLYREGYYLSPPRKAAAVLLHALGLREKLWLNLYEKIQVPYEKAKYVGTPSWYAKISALHPIECFKPIELEFENKHFTAPEGYDTILRDLYGDYMTPPPKEKQVRTHSAKMYWVE